MYTIRRLTYKDIPDIYAISSKVLLSDFPEYSPKVATIYAQHIHSRKHFRKLMKSKSNIMYGSFEASKLVGFICLKGDDGGVIYVDLLVIKKEYRGKGIGTTLLKKAETWGLDHHYHYLWLFTESNKNIEYYKRRGFRYVGVHQNAWFGADEHMLSKVIRDQPFAAMFEKYFKKRKS